jgi:dienelactone hydrolase
MVARVHRSLLVALVALALVAAGCGSSNEAEPATRPPNVADKSFQWAKVSAPGGHHLLVGTLKSPKPGKHVGVLLVTGTEGLTTGYPELAEDLVARGFDVAVGCWFGNQAVTPPSQRIDCSGAPPFVGVTEDAVPDHDALVDGARGGLGDYSTLALVGLSRGGGIAMLRAADGSTDPVVSLSGMLEGTTNLGEEPNEVNVVSRADRIKAPVLILHGEADNVVPVTQARDMEQALRAHGADVVAKYYPGADHALALNADVRADMVEQITQFLCARATCPGR